MIWFETLRQGHWLSIVASALLTISLLLARRAALGALKRSRVPVETRQRWLNQVEVGTLLLLLGGLVLVWGEQLRDLSFSLFAIAAAIVIASKEILVCLSGAFIRTVSQEVSVGDRIRVKEWRGDVIETGALTTTLLEVSPGSQRQTGRSIVVPNQVFTIEPVFNESHTGEYGLHLLRVPVRKDSGWQDAEKRLLAAANEVCRDHVEHVRRHIDAVGWTKGLGPDSTDPRITLEIRDPDTIDLLLRYPTPVHGRAAIEQRIIRAYLGDPTPPGLVSAAPPTQDPPGS